MNDGLASRRRRAHPNRCAKSVTLLRNGTPAHSSLQPRLPAAFEAPLERISRRKARSAQRRGSEKAVRRTLNPASRSQKTAGVPGISTVGGEGRRILGGGPRWGLRFTSRSAAAIGNRPTRCRRGSQEPLRQPVGAGHADRGAPLLADRVGEAVRGRTTRLSAGGHAAGRPKPGHGHPRAQPQVPGSLRRVR